MWKLWNLGWFAWGSALFSYDLLWKVRCVSGSQDWSPTTLNGKFSTAQIGKYVCVYSLDKEMTVLTRNLQVVSKNSNRSLSVKTRFCHGWSCFGGSCPYSPLVCATWRCLPNSHMKYLLLCTEHELSDLKLLNIISFVIYENKICA